MRAVHSLTITAKCPMNGQRDFYELTVEVPAHVTLPVEELLKEAERFVNTAIFQENLTKCIASAARETAKSESIKVRTVGYHTGVRTEVTA